MADKYSELLSFVRIAESGSLSEAGRRLGLSLTAISRRLSQLETRLGVPLIRRNSRYLTLTDEGMLFYSRTAPALMAIEEAEEGTLRAATEAAGALRVVTTIGFGRSRLAPLLQQYAMLHPEVHLHIQTADQASNIVETGHDIGICFDPPPDSALVMKRLCENPRMLCASPAYLERRGRPRRVTDLAAHDRILIGGGSDEVWRSVDAEDALTSRSFSTNDGELARQWAIDGAGLVVKSLWDVADDLEEGRLEAVLPGLALPSSPVVALYLPAQRSAAKVRSFLNFLARNLRIEPRRSRADALAAVPAPAA
jgi:DNA-binding transcriptional LysR family regulator